MSDEIDKWYLSGTLQVPSGAIMPSIGNNDDAGILFPNDPGGGGGDKAWIRYYARSGEKTALEIGVANDSAPIYQDDILLMPSGGVGVGIKEVMANARLSIEGGAIAIGASASAFKKADAALHIFSSYGGFDRLLQMSPNAPSKPGLNLLASHNSANQEQWWSWGVTVENSWRINSGTSFSPSGGLTIDVNGHTRIDGDMNVVGRISAGKGSFVVGMIVMWSGNSNTIPPGWALCDGNNGTPNLRGRFIVGFDNNDPDYNSPNKTGGEKRHTLSEAELPAHSHSGETNDTTQGISLPQGGGMGGTHVLAAAAHNNGWNDGALRHTHSFTTHNTGRSQSFDNRPPYYVLAYIMYTGN
jgi:microcystin-dependent protein